MHLILDAALLAAGYVIGRYRPGHRASDWANSEKFAPTRRHSSRWWAMWSVLSAENIAWLITHPVQGAHAWRNRNDPPPARSAAIEVHDIRGDI